MVRLKIIIAVFIFLFLLNCKSQKHDVIIKSKFYDDKQLTLSKTVVGKPEDSIALNVPVGLLFENLSSEKMVILNYKTFIQNNSESWRHLVFNENKEEFKIDKEVVNPHQIRNFKFIIGLIISRKEADNILKKKNSEKDINTLNGIKDSINIGNISEFSKLNPGFFSRYSKPKDSIGFMFVNDDDKKNIKIKMIKLKL